MKTIYIFFLLLTAKPICALVESYSINDIETFKLKSVEGKFYTKENLKGKFGTIIIFLSNHCRVSQKFQDYIILMCNILEEKGIKLFVVSPNFEKAILPDELAYTDSGDSFEEMKERANWKKYNFPFIYDGEKQIITKSLNVKITPTAYLFNKFGKLIYSGRLGNHDKPFEIENSELYQAVKRLLIGDFKYVRTKVFGTSIRFQEDMKLVEKVHKRYAHESIYLNYGDERKLNFFLKQNTNYPRFFYIWSIHDNPAQTRENLITISSSYKIFRKRGLKVFTVCICEEEEKKIALEILKRAQLSSLNFYTSGNEISELSNLRSSGGYKTTPFCRLLHGDGKFDYGTNGLITQKKLKNSFLSALNLEEYKKNQK